MNIAKEVPWLQHRAVECDERIVGIEPLVFLSTDTEGAWMPEPADPLAARLAVGGDSLPVHVGETEISFAIGRQGHARIEYLSFTPSRRL